MSIVRKGRFRVDRVRRGSLKNLVKLFFLLVVVALLGNIDRAFELGAVQHQSQPIGLPPLQEYDQSNQTNSGHHLDYKHEQNEHSSENRRSRGSEEETRKNSSPTSQSDLQNTSMECQLKWDVDKNTHLINKWLEMELPILVAAIRHHRGKKKHDSSSNAKDSQYYQYTKDDIVYAILTQKHGRQKQTIMDFQLIPWVCLYNETDGENDDGKSDRRGAQELATLVPRKRDKGDQIVVMCNATTLTTENVTIALTGVLPSTPQSQISEDSRSTNTTKNKNDAVEPSIFFYDLEQPLECDRLEEQEKSEVHEKNKIGACLRFKGDYDRSIVPQWIEYHRLIGVEHFWVYVNEEWNLSGLFNQSYITYIPFNFNWAENNHSSHFPHHYIDVKKNEISQEPAQSACIYNARKYGYDWIITTDVDEYVHVPKGSNKTNDEAESPLELFLRRYDRLLYSCLIMNSIPYGRNMWLKEPDFPSNPFLIDYVWRRNMNLSEYPLYRYKQIYNPQQVWSLGVHYCYVADGEQNLQLPAEDGLFLQHFKLAHKGVYKKFEKLMLKSEDDLLKDTTVRDMYRSDLADAMTRLEMKRKYT
ncbi:unnamed protein product [Pseudo-nitzschia multistriata]|uniref:Glycosyltransferase family 92 protein n=1 Tax=Pseudo-nitzschia multistriata TaxID=183589 RepID=A0A448ZG76_9STRA|nr:unnamed protein product [Pseudo-nitzschia multistriata]